MLDKKVENRAKSATRGRLIGALLVLVAIIVAFVIYIDQTHKFVISQNEHYSETTTSQLARRMNTFFEDSQTCLEMSAIAFGNTLTSPEVKGTNLHNLASDTMFEYVLYASADGTMLNEKGFVTDTVDREYVELGLQGHSGLCVIMNSEFFNGTNVIVAYEPLRYEDKIIGVLAGIFTQKSLATDLSSQVFGSEAATFLCDPDGTIISSSDSKYDNVHSVFDLGTNSMGYENSPKPDMSKLEYLFSTGGSGVLSYQTSAGTGCAYTTKLDSYDLMILSAFPISVTNALANSNNALGLTLMAAVIGIFAIYIFVLIFQGYRQRAALKAQNERINSTLDASTNLFKRFAVFDLTNMTYKYHKAEGVNEAIPMSGPLNVFTDYWTSTIEDPESRKMMIDALRVENIRENLMLGVPFLRYEFQSTTADGTSWLQVSIVSMRRDENGVVDMALYAVQDVTEIKQREIRSREALEEAYKAAEHASQAKSNFLSSMSHDIRTPMNTIMGLTAIASMNMDDPVRVRDCLSKINVANRHLLGLINEVLDMAKIESGNISLSEEAFDISDVVEDVMLIVRPQTEAKHQIFNINISNMEHEQMIGDPMRLKQVFLNLLGNAVKFTPEGGTVTFAMEEMPSSLQDHACYKFTFSDTGCGITPEFMEHLFEPFTRAEDLRISKIEGTGLGLPIVKSIVELMNGNIEVSSVLDEGTTFTVVVYMKMVDDDSNSSKQLSGLDVLIIDDDEASCQNATTMLSEIGMNSEYVTTGKDAIELVAKREAEGRGYPVVVTDWKLNGEDGRDVVRVIRKIASPDMAILLMSSYDWSEIESEARAVGVNEFVSKPLFKSRLTYAIRKAISGEDDESGPSEVLGACDLTGKRILLTDDNELASEVTTDLLTMTHADIEQAFNGKEAYDKLLENEPGHFDLVLMDVQMPVMNGHEAARAIRNAAEEQERPDLAEIPIIALTADAFSDDVEKAKASGMNAHISKPLELENLARVLNEWI